MTAHHHTQPSKAQEKAEKIAEAWSQDPQKQEYLKQILHDKTNHLRLDAAHRSIEFRTLEAWPEPLATVKLLITEDEFFAKEVIALNDRIHTQEAAQTIATEWANDAGKAHLLQELLHDADGKLTHEATSAFLKHTKQMPPSNLTVAQDLIKDSPEFAKTLLKREEKERASADIGPKNWSAAILEQKHNLTGIQR